MLERRHEIWQDVRVAARWLALTVHDTECLTCAMTLENPSPESIAWVELRRRKCENRARIEALGR